MDADVMVIGAGLAGLQCARRVQRGGLSVMVLEREDAVGGRVSTERVDGFLCDRGFQLLNPAYPAVRHWIDLLALELQKFAVGVVVRSGQETRTRAHPIRHPRYALSTVRSGLAPVSDLLALTRWLAPTLLRPARATAPGHDDTLRVSLDAAGLTGPLRTAVLDTFLAGVLADSSGDGSAKYARSLMRFFALGAPGLPRRGMQALPEQMTASLADPVRRGTDARELQQTAEGVKVSTDAGTLRARVAVLAVAAQDVAGFTHLVPPATRGLTTWWFRAPNSRRNGKLLMLDASRHGGGPAGPVWHTAVVSHAAPSYAPHGEHLVQATTLLDRPDGLASEAEVRRDLARRYQCATTGWDVLAHHVVPHALPAQSPPLKDRHPVWMNNNLLVTGDRRGTGSIQGAFTAGDKVARDVLGRLGP